MHSNVFICVALILVAASNECSACACEKCPVPSHCRRLRMRLEDTWRQTRYSDPSDKRNGNNVRSKREEQLRQLKQKFFGKMANKAIVEDRKLKRVNVRGADISGKTANQM